MDTLIATESGEGPLGEVCVVVHDDVVGVPEPDDDVLEERDDCGPVQLPDGLCFYPLGELVHRHQQMPARARLKGPTMSNPQTTKGHVIGIILSITVRMCLCWLNS